MKVKKEIEDKKMENEQNRYNIKKDIYQNIIVSQNDCSVVYEQRDSITSN